MTYFASGNEMRTSAKNVLFRAVMPAVAFVISSHYWRHPPVQAADAPAALHDQLVSEVNKITFRQKVNDVMSVTDVKVDGLRLTFMYNLESASQFNDQLKASWTKNACSDVAPKGGISARDMMAQGASYRYEYWTDGAFVGGFDVVCGNA